MDTPKGLYYHEAAHVVVGFVVGVPIGEVHAHPSLGGRVQMKRWYRWTRAFREVSSRTVRRDIIWSLAGKYGEMLAGQFRASASDFDFYFTSPLARRFRLDMEKLERATWSIVFAEREAIVRIAHIIEERGHLSEFDVALLYMEWMAHGRRAHRLATSSI